MGLFGVCSPKSGSEQYHLSTRSAWLWADKLWTPPKVICLPLQELPVLCHFSYKKVSSMNFLSRNLQVFLSHFIWHHQEVFISCSLALLQVIAGCCYITSPSPPHIDYFSMRILWASLKGLNEVQVDNIHHSPLISYFIVEPRLVGLAWLLIIFWLLTCNIRHLESSFC